MTIKSDGSDSLKKNAKKIQKQKTQKTFMKKTADSVKNWKKQKKKFVSSFSYAKNQEYIKVEIYLDET